MKPTSVPDGVRRKLREECAIGDWVDADDVSDWARDLPSHGYRQDAISICPGAGDLGSMILSSRPQRWLFIAHSHQGKLVWMRRQ